MAEGKEDDDGDGASSNSPSEEQFVIGDIDDWGLPHVNGDWETRARFVRTKNEARVPKVIKYRFKKHKCLDPDCMDQIMSFWWYFIEEWRHPKPYFQDGERKLFCTDIRFVRFMAACVIFYSGPAVMNLKDKYKPLSSYYHITIHNRYDENMNFLNLFALVQNFLLPGETYEAFFQGYQVGHKCHNVRSLIKNKGFFEDGVVISSSARGVAGIHVAYKKFLNQLQFHYY